MNKSTTRLLFLLMTACFVNEAKGIPCSKTGTKGMAACQCNFMGACDAKGKKNPNLARYLPTGVDQFGLVEGRNRNLAYLCEGGGAVGILYDCNNRIPLFATTVIPGAQLKGKSSGGRPRDKFSQSKLLDQSFQQEDGDYVSALKRELCYNTTRGKYLVEMGWLRANGYRKRLRTNNCPKIKEVKTTVHRGHLIASQYGRNNQPKKKATFIYTNAVPQFGVFNSQPWQLCESRLITWGNKNCAQVKGAKDVRLFIVVGAIPSTVRVSSKRYFGKKGFSDYKDTSASGNYRVNVPSDMWTAACCTYSDKGTLKYRSTAFWRENNPGKASCNRGDVNTLTKLLSRRIRGGTVSFNLFPQTSQCNNKKNYIRLP